MKHLSAEPKDTNARLKLGDLHLKRGDPQAAIEAYSQVASQFSKGGFDAKAVAIFKQILKIDGSYLDAHIELGDHFQRMGLTTDALREFQEAVEICTEQGLKKKAFELLKRVAALDPSNVANRLSLADLFLREGMQNEAREEYAALLAVVEEDEEEPENLERVAKQMVEAFPTEEKPYLALATAKQRAGQAAAGAQVLADALPQFPTSLEMRESIVALSEASGDNTLAQNMYKEMAELYKQRGDADKAREIMQRHVVVAEFGDSSPETSPSLILSDEAADTTNGIAGGMVDDDDDLDMDLELDDPVVEEPPKPKAAKKKPEPKKAARKKAEAKPPKAKKPEPKPAPEPEAPSEIEELVAEARVSIEFGDPDGARQCIDKALAIDANCVAAQELLAELDGGGDEVELEVEASEPGAAGEEFEEADLGDAGYNTLPDIELVLEDEEDEDDAFVSVEPPIELAASDDERKARADAAADDLDGLEIEVDFDDEDEIVVEDQPEPEPTEEAAPADPHAEALGEADAFMEAGDTGAAEKIYRKVLKTAPSHPQALLRLGEIAARQGEEPSTVGEAQKGGALEVEIEEQASEFVELDLDPAELEFAAELPSVTPEDTIPPAEEPEILDEPEATQSEDTAVEETLEDIAAEFEDEDEAEEEEAEADTGISLNAADLEAEAIEEAEAALEGLGEEDGFDLAAELGEEAGPALEEDFQEVFNAFKRGVQQQVGEEESEAHYDLAIAYKEMGLLDDAVEQLEMVRRSGTMQVESLSLLATCKVDLGRPQEAAGHLSEALVLVSDGDAAGTSLRYDLGCALLAAGKNGEALEAFQKVAAADEEFRDVQERIAELGG